MIGMSREVRIYIYKLTSNQVITIGVILVINILKKAAGFYNKG